MEQCTRPTQDSHHHQQFKTFVRRCVVRPAILVLVVRVASIVGKLILHGNYLFLSTIIFDHYSFLSIIIGQSMSILGLPGAGLACLLTFLLSLTHLLSTFVGLCVSLPWMIMLGFNGYVHLF